MRINTIGLRCVKPYYYVNEVSAKGRWYGKSIAELFTSEFKQITLEQVQQQIQSKTLFIRSKVSKETTLNTVINEHDVLVSTLHRHEPPVPHTEIQILETTPDYIVINKPSGIPVHPTGRYNYNSITMILSEEHYFDNLKPLFRLDKNTSGLLILGRTKSFAKHFQTALAQKSKGIETIEKIYVARVNGLFPESIEVNAPLKLTHFGVEAQNEVSDDGIEARSSFKRIRYDKISDTSIVECIPHTGRTHQLRLHLLSIGHPISNDSAYVLKRIHNSREVDGDIEREKKYQEIYHWQYDPTCPDCLFPKGDLLEHEIWLHACQYTFNGKVYKTAFPQWANEEFDVKSSIDKWAKNN
ncbi:Ribosomal pseudouridine synthase [Entamoeba marina]